MVILLGSRKVSKAVALVTLLSETTTFPRVEVSVVVENMIATFFGLFASSAELVRLISNLLLAMITFAPLTFCSIILIGREALKVQFRTVTSQERMLQNHNGLESLADVLFS